MGDHRLLLQLFAFGDDPDPGRDDGLRGQPTVIANPPGDVAFRALIDQFLSAGGRRPADLEAALRLHHPRAVVRPRSLAGERFEVWYAYREGHWIGQENHDQT